MSLYSELHQWMGAWYVLVFFHFWTDIKSTGLIESPLSLSALCDQPFSLHWPHSLTFVSYKRERGNSPNSKELLTWLLRNILLWLTLLCALCGLSMSICPSHLHKVHSGVYPWLVFSYYYIVWNYASLEHFLCKPSLIYSFKIAFWLSASISFLINQISKTYIAGSRSNSAIFSALMYRAEQRLAPGCDSACIHHLRRELRR